MKNLITLLACTSILPILHAHEIAENGMLMLDENRKPKERTILNIPDIKGYLTLKCDLHMHTVFSDGLVWPTIRVEEAWREGLDAIAITDHLEYSPHKDDMIINHNRPFETAKGAAKMTNVLLIQGSEITRDTPPGHFNAIYVTDSSVLQTPKEKGNLELDKQAVDRAAEQGAFIFWNHPGWKAQSIDGSYEWIDFVDTISKEGKLNGIEVINGFKLHLKALDWALEHDLAVLGSSDIHNLIANDYDMERGVTRSMTLVFAKERSPESLREALEAKRTVAWSTRILAGREKWVRALFDASVATSPVFAQAGSWAHANIDNNSDLYFELELLDADKGSWPATITLNPATSQVLRFNPEKDGNSARYTVKNAYIGGSANLVVEINASR